MEPMHDDNAGQEEVRAAGPATPEQRREAVFRMNLDSFGGRAAQLCTLVRRGRITTDACFLALTQLWIQLARSHGARERPGEVEERPPTGS